MSNIERVGSVGSPSSTSEIVVDILDSASQSRLIGSMLYIESQQDNEPIVITGQVTGITMQNRWHQNDTFRAIIKTDGSLPYLSGRQDVRTASYSVGAVFAKKPEGVWKEDTLGNVPSTGFAVNKLTQELVDDLVSIHGNTLFKFGYAYGDENVILPMYLKHYGDTKTGGQGEAHHTLVVGKTGSGKSTLAKMMLAGYSRHDDMAMMIIDPKGEFSEEISGYKVGDSGLLLKEIFNGYGRTSVRYGITQVKLETYELFREILLSTGFHKDLNIRKIENGEFLTECIEEIIRKSKMTLDTLSDRDSLTHVVNELLDEENDYLSRIYKSQDPRDALQKELEKVLDNPEHRARKTWNFVAFLFGNGSGRRPSIGNIVDNLIKSKSGNRPIISLDLSVPGNKRDMLELRAEMDEDVFGFDDDEKDLFTESLQKKIIYRILSELRRRSETVVSERHRKGDRSNVNTMVVFEEAHRFAPRYLSSDDEDGKKLTQKLIEGVRETRKYGLAWFFIDQTIGGIHKEITQQVRTIWAGFGLSMGDELERLKELTGGDSRDISLYQAFKDPASYGSNKDRKFSWMAFGPVSPMTSNRPIFIHAFSGPEFIEKNNIPVSEVEPEPKKFTHMDKDNKSVIKKPKAPAIARGKPKVDEGFSLDDIDFNGLL